MHCETCKYWKPTYAPYVLHSRKYIMTCHKDGKDKPDFNDKCKYWESADEGNIRDSNNICGI